MLIRSFFCADPVFGFFPEGDLFSVTRIRRQPSGRVRANDVRVNLEACTNTKPFHFAASSRKNLRLYVLHGVLASNEHYTAKILVSQERGLPALFGRNRY
jgi:hypothetical protein